MITENKLNIFFAPVSSGVLYSNFEKSVITGITACKILNHFPNNIRIQNSTIRFWGIRDAKKTTFLKTKTDI